MPNGTVDHFQLSCSELVEMLSQFDSDSIIGEVNDWSDPGSSRPLTVATLKQIAQESVEEKVIVFEQDYGEYILPFSGTAFVSIDEKSVFYERLARCHDEYKVKLLAEHRRRSQDEGP
ncbi:MAG TPA: hypothetical protein VHV50_06945 [Actinomycetota bacterium]|jgi:hypothetical protein|nr:hypothetical protein [Actinomycetota bacterium]